jgi:hypothetical protein
MELTTAKQRLAELGQNGRINLQSRHL